MSDLLDQIKKDLDQRIKQLRPAVEELEKLERARVQLDRVADGESRGGRRSPTASGNGRRRRRRGRPRKGQPTRAEEVRRLLHENPEGMKVAEAARELGMDKPNSLYSVTRKLEQQGQLKKKDGRLVFAESRSAATAASDQ